MAWYIDAIDVRAGFAFAAKRDSDLRSKVLRDAPSAFIGPPNFFPEPVDGRSSAFALARRQAQLGFFLDKEEVPFRSIEAVAEFVGRVYLRGSGGNGPGEDGVPPLPGPEGEGGEPPALPTMGTYDLDPVNELIELAGTFRTRSSNIGRGAGESAPVLRLTPPAAAASSDRLVRAALRLLYEIVRGRPRGGDNVAAASWHQTPVRFMHMVFRLELARRIFEMKWRDVQARRRAFSEGGAGGSSRGTMPSACTRRWDTAAPTSSRRRTPGRSKLPPDSCPPGGAHSKLEDRAAALSNWRAYWRLPQA
jgi:hypothetical protein